MSFDKTWLKKFFVFVPKVPLKSTPRFLCYHVETKTYAVATSSEKQSSKMYRFNGEDKELVEETRPDNFPLPTVVSFAVQLFSPVSWDVIPETKIAMEDYEHITDMKNVALTYEGAASGLKVGLDIYLVIVIFFVQWHLVRCHLTRQA